MGFINIINICQYVFLDFGTLKYQCLYHPQKSQITTIRVSISRLIHNCLKKQFQKAFATFCVWRDRHVELLSELKMNHDRDHLNSS